MLIDLQADQQELWQRLYTVARSWYQNYAELRYSDPRIPDLRRLASALVSSDGWRARTGEHWELDFTAFSEALGRDTTFEQVRIDIGDIHLSCIIELSKNGAMTLELSLWPPDLLGVDEAHFEQLVAASDVPVMPATFPSVLQVARALRDACDFRRVELAMEGDA